MGENLINISELLEKNKKLAVKNQELEAWLREIEAKNDELQKENELLRKVLKEVLQEEIQMAKIIIGDKVIENNNMEGSI